MSNPDLNPQEKHQAYKTGYRFGLKGRSLSQIPSQIRGNTQLRNLYDEGWHEAQQEIKAGGQHFKTQYIRHRVSWILMTALAGIITAYLIIQSRYDAPTELEINPTEIADAPISKLKPLQANWESMDSSSLNLLSDQERQSLSVIHLARPVIPKQAISSFNQPLDVRLYNGHDKEQIFSAGESLPKYVRQLIFEVNRGELDPPMALTVRWLWQRQLMQSQTWPAGQSIILSKQPLFSGQQGNWDIEILDPSGQVIYLYQFSYVQ